MARACNLSSCLRRARRKLRASTVGRRRASSALDRRLSAEPRVRVFSADSPARRSRRSRARSTAVVAASRSAAEAGIASGTKLNTALALAASLQVFERAPSLERKSLESLAAWAEMLTSVVSIEAPDSVLLEVAGSLKLFGSLEAIKAKPARASLGVIAISDCAPRRRRPALVVGASGERRCCNGGNSPAAWRRCRSR